LPVVVNQSVDQAERELILRQLFSIRQDTEAIKQVLSQGGGSVISQAIPALIGGESDLHLSARIEQNPKMIRDEAIGDMTLQDLEQEAIERTLKYFGNNRRAAAKSLGMSERTLYRKIDNYGLERKIKRNDHE